MVVTIFIFYFFLLQRMLRRLRGSPDREPSVKTENLCVFCEETPKDEIRVDVNGCYEPLCRGCRDSYTASRLYDLADHVTSLSTTWFTGSNSHVADVFAEKFKNLPEIEASSCVAYEDYIRELTEELIESAKTTRVERK